MRALMTTRTPALVVALMIVLILSTCSASGSRSSGARHVVLEVDADGAGRDDPQHDLGDRVGRGRVGMLDVGRHGTFTARTIRDTASIISRDGTMPPSG